MLELLDSALELVNDFPGDPAGWEVRALSDCKLIAIHPDEAPRFLVEIRDSPFWEVRELGLSDFGELDFPLGHTL